MPEYIKTKIEDLDIGDTIMWRGKVCLVEALIGPASVKVQEYKRRKVAIGTLAGKWYTVTGVGEVDRVKI